MLCMMCKRYNCREQLCPGDDDPDNALSGGFECPYYQAMPTPISDETAVDILLDIETVYEENEFAKQTRMERALLEILKQLGYEKTVKFFEKQNFDVPFRGPYKSPESR